MKWNDELFINLAGWISWGCMLSIVLSTSILLDCKILGCI